MLNIVVPMAGRGSRFVEAGYQLPKPLIPVHGTPMIEVVVNNLRPSVPHRFTFICQQEHTAEYGLGEFLRGIAPGCAVVELCGVTAGAACTVLMASDVADCDDPMMIANCDQWINASIDDYLKAFNRSGADGFVMTMTSDKSKWSYVRRDESGRVTGVVEKQVVSDEATVGIYNFARGSDFFRSARGMIAADARVNGEFYVAPTYTWMIKEGARIETDSIGCDRSGMYGLGTPPDLEYFLQCGFETRLFAERGAAVVSRAA